MTISSSINLSSFSNISRVLSSWRLSTVAILSLFQFVRYSDAVENGNLGSALASLAKTEVLVPREWKALTENNEAISEPIQTIIGIASDFQDSIENSEVFQPGYLCKTLEDLFFDATEFEELIINLMASYGTEEEEIDKMRQITFDPLDQSIKEILNLQIEGLIWKPSATNLATII
ncbi:hypothetical protein AA313_de0203690 [Arthrobotrys entomopaga]|nr:hypothetical protein AA313_de0203690 [Arthrobotrys entomopaga]